MSADLIQPRTASLPVAPFPATEDDRRELTAWPVLALFWGFPVWWALGCGVLVFPLLAVPMAWQLIRRGDIRVPPLFGWWLLFAGWQVWGLLTLGVNNPMEYLSGTTTSRLAGWGLRIVSIAAVTVLGVFVWNLDRRTFSARRLLNSLAWLCLVTIVGGYVGILAPHAEFTAPLEYVLPQGVRTTVYVQSLVHPAFAQLNDVLGFVSPRPKAPFEYTNTWGNNLAVLLVLLLPWAVVGGRLRRRTAAAALMTLAAVVPIVLSLNRGVWLGLVLAAVFLAATFARQRKPSMAVAISVGLVLVLGVVALTPLKTILNERAQHGHSNVVRSEIDQGSMQLSLQSPVIGLGSSRTANGGAGSIAAGRSSACPQCANVVYGSNGFLWATLVANGVVGAAMYFGWLTAILWRTRRFVGGVAAGTRAVLVLALFFSVFYDHYPSAIALFWMAVVLLFQSQQEPPAQPAEAMRP